MGDDWPYGNDTMRVPAFLVTEHNGAELAAWKLAHPDWFVAGTWFRPSARSSVAPTSRRSLAIRVADKRNPADPRPNPFEGSASGGGSYGGGTPDMRPGRRGDGIDPLPDRFLRPPGQRPLPPAPGSGLPDALPLSPHLPLQAPPHAEAVDVTGPSAPIKPSLDARPTLRLLRREFERRGEIERGDGNEAHHIGPRGGAMSGARDPAAIQGYLRDHGIDIDGLENGVVLSEEFHRRLHTAGYYAYVEHMLSLATTPAQTRIALDLLREQLRIFEMEFQRTERMPDWATQ